MGRSCSTLRVRRAHESSGTLRRSCAQCRAEQSYRPNKTTRYDALSDLAPVLHYGWPYETGSFRQRQTSREAGTQSRGSGMTPDSRATEERGGLTPTSGERPHSQGGRHGPEGWSDRTQRWKRITAWSLAALSCAWLVGAPGASRRPAASGIIVDIPGADAVLYEVTENMYLHRRRGQRRADPAQSPSPGRPTPRSSGGPVSATCSARAGARHQRAPQTCSVTADGIDNISLLDGQGRRVPGPSPSWSRTTTPPTRRSTS